MKTRHIALAFCWLLAVPADMIAARAATSDTIEAPKTDTAKPETKTAALPTGTDEQIRESYNYRYAAQMIALNEFVTAACPTQKFDPVGAAALLSNQHIETEGLDKARVRTMADQQVAFYRGMDAKAACGIIHAEWGPIGTFGPDVVVAK
jgi:hypothetical protein